MAKLVDAADLKSAGRKAVGVQVPLPPSLRSVAAQEFVQIVFLGGPKRPRPALGTKTTKRGQIRNGFRQGDLQGYQGPNLIRINCDLKDPGNPVTLSEPGLLNRHS